MVGTMGDCSLAEAIGPIGGPVISVLGWDAGSQSFKPWAAANPDTGAFAIDPNAGYFVRLSEPILGFSP